MGNPTATGNCNLSRQATLPLIGMTEFIRRERRDITLDDITANYHKSNPCSIEANKKVRQSASKIKQTILATLRSAGEVSCETLEGLTGFSHQTCSPRITELLRDGKIVVAGSAITKSGCKARTFRLT